MIAILLHRSGARFSRIDKAEALSYDHDFDERQPWDPDWVASAFEMAQVDLNFGSADDLILLIDRPFAYSVAQSVPFTEKQLPQVLENYLEEEIPNDIEMFQFDHRLLSSKGQHSAVLGFWIPKNILSTWCQFADENSFNSLDIQPAELYLFDLGKATSSFTIVKDLDGQLRYAGLNLKDTLPQLTLGSWLPSCSPELAIKTLRLQGSDWKQYQQLILDQELQSWGEHFEQLGLNHDDLRFKAFSEDPFCTAALQAKPTGLDFRKGEFAQKGILERVLWPCALAALFVSLWILTLSWSTFKATQVIDKTISELNREKSYIWKELFPNKRVPQTRMESQMKGLYKNMTGDGGNSQGQDEQASSLQALGLLFTHISPDDDIIIEDAIIDKSIILKGVSTDADSVAKLSEGFGGNNPFEAPNVSTTDKGRNPDYPTTFRFTTRYTGSH
jgi:hypothetical protein